MPRIVTQTIDESALRTTLNQFSRALTTLYLESETRVVLEPLSAYLGPKITLPPVRWLTGRAFGKTLEIRWTLNGDLFECATLSESKDPAAFPAGWGDSAWNPLLDTETRPRDVLLAGVNSRDLPPDHMLYNAQPDGGLWVETRLARPLHYPVSDPKAKRVVLRCVDYLSRGLVVLTRLSELVPYKDAP